MTNAQTPYTLAKRHEASPMLQRFVFPAYLAFSVCFYSLRFLFGWGEVGTTTYESDMPGYLAALKDVVWVGMVGAALFSRSMEKAIEQAKRHPTVYLILALFCSWMVLCSSIHVLFLYEPMGDSLLNSVRKPLEYIPAALLAPAFIGSWKKIGATWKRLNWIAIAFAAFEFVAVVRGWKHTGFDWGGLSIRFGGIFGSPNDWGIYSACAIFAVLALGKDRIQLLGFVPGLLLSQSRSALAGSLVALGPLLYRANIRRIVMPSLALVLLLGFAVSSLVPMSSDEILESHVGLDVSAMNRLDEISKFQEKFRDLDNFAALLFGVQRFHIESFYLALIVSAGVPALTLYVAALGMSIVRGWTLRKTSVLHLVALCAVVVISTASLFVPFPDIYPTNFYLWLAIGVLWMEPLSQPVVSVRWANSSP